MAIIKPDALAAGHGGSIVSLLARKEFRIAACMETQLSFGEAVELYAEHDGRPFFGELVRFMTSGRVIALVLEREHAVALLRARFGTVMPANAMHASDSPLAAKREIGLLFDPRELPEATDLRDGCDEPVPAAGIAGAMASEESSE